MKKYFVNEQTILMYQFVSYHVYNKYHNVLLKMLVEIFKNNSVRKGQYKKLIISYPAFINASIALFVSITPFLCFCHS